MDIEIAPGKRARQAYSFDDIAIVPSRRTRDPEDVSTTWQIDAYKFELPMLAAPMDSVVSPETAIEIGRLGGLGVLNLEGLWTRYEDPRIPLGEIASMPDKHATRRMQEIYSAPIRPELIKERIKTIRDAGVTVAASLSPARTAEFHKAVIAAGVDIFVIRGTTVSAEHVASEREELNLKKFIYELDVPVIVGGVATTKFWESKFQWHQLWQKLQQLVVNTLMNLVDAMFTLLQMVQSVALAILLKQLQWGLMRS